MCADASVEKPFLAFVVYLGQLIVGLGLVEFRFGCPHLFTLKGDEFLPGIDPISQNSMDFSDPGREGVADDGLLLGMGEDLSQGLKLRP